MKVNNEWINISDMMSGLMMVFMFIAIAIMMDVKKKESKVKEIVMTYRESQEALYKDLLSEFENDLKKWDAEILEDNTFRFKSPDVLFRIGSSHIKSNFKTILDDFFPRYISVIHSKEFLGDIDEIRVEGHTSSLWKSSGSDKTKFLNNMALSQNRAKSVLKYCFLIVQDKDIREWLALKLKANGMAYSNIIKDVKGIEDFKKSQRVEFKVLTNAQEKIYRIIEELGVEG